MREWPNRTVSKTVVPSGYRGFESHSLRSLASRRSDRRAAQRAERSTMTLALKDRGASATGTEHVDVLIVGGGHLGIGTAHHLLEQ